MEYKMNEEILQSAIDTYGSNAQHYMLLEEMAELQKEICKDHRCINNPRTDLVSEIADVLIMIEQIIMMHEIDRNEIQGYINMKLVRTKSIINLELDRRKRTYCEMEHDYRCQFDE